MLGLTEEQTEYDEDILMHINTTLGMLSQLGVDVPDDFVVSSENQQWNEITTDSKMIRLLKEYMYLKIRIIFDPPTGSVLDAVEKVISELEWRISILAEDK